MKTGTVPSKDGTTIAFEESGNGPHLVLVDGALAYREHHGGRPLAAELAKSLTVTAYDRRGRGESTDTLPYSVEREIEDIEALIDRVGGRAYLYGFSSGAVLALKAASKLGDKVARLVLHEPPFNADDDNARQEFAEFARHLSELLAAGKRSDAVTLFFADMLPPDVIADMKQSPIWPTMEAVAHTLAYDNAVLGDGSVPVEIAKAATMPALVLVGDESDDFKHKAVEALVKALPCAQKKTLEGQATMVSPEALAPVLVTFLNQQRTE